MPAAQPPTLREQLAAALGAFSKQPLRDAGRALFKTLGYESELGMDLKGKDEFLATFDSNQQLNRETALVADWTDAQMLIQLTDADIGRAGAGDRSARLRPLPAFASYGRRGALTPEEIWLVEGSSSR